MHAARICLGTVQARTHVQLTLACEQSMIRAQHRLRFTMQHVYVHGGIWSNQCADPAAALGTFGLPPVGFILILTHPCVLMAGTASARSWNGYSTFEQLQRHLTRTEFSDGFFSSGPPCLCALYVSYSHVFLMLAGFRSLWVVCFPKQVMDSLFYSRFSYRVSTITPSTICGILYWSCFPRAGQWYFRFPSRGNRPLCFKEEVLVSAR